MKIFAREEQSIALIPHDKAEVTVGRGLHLRPRRVEIVAVTDGQDREWLPAWEATVRSLNAKLKEAEEDIAVLDSMNDNKNRIIEEMGEEAMAKLTIISHLRSKIADLQHRLERADDNADTT